MRIEGRIAPLQVVARLIYTQGVDPHVGIIEQRQADGFASLSLSVNRSNAEAVALYRSAGFTPREEVASSNDDSVTMLLDL